MDGLKQMGWIETDWIDWRIKGSDEANGRIETDWKGLKQVEELKD